MEKIFHIVFKVAQKRKKLILQNLILYFLNNMWYNIDKENL